MPANATQADDNALHGLIDLERYPIDQLDGERGRVLVEECRAQLGQDGCVVLKGFVPDEALIYEVMKDDQLKSIIIPIEGYGLWSTLYGYLAIAPDLTTILGITYYDQKETAGLGGEVENPAWKAKWVGRKAFDERGRIKIAVNKGPAGPPDEDPYRVDGLSGATITSRGVTNMLHFWLGQEGFGSYLSRLRSQAGA